MPTNTGAAVQGRQVHQTRPEMRLACPCSRTVMLRKMLCESGRASSSKVSAGVSGSTAARRIVQKNPSFEVTYARRRSRSRRDRHLAGCRGGDVEGSWHSQYACRQAGDCRDVMRMRAGSAVVTRRLYWSLDHSSETLLLRCCASGAASIVCCAAMLDRRAGSRAAGEPRDGGSGHSGYAT